MTALHPCPEVCREDVVSAGSGPQVTLSGLLHGATPEDPGLCPSFTVLG